jgi:phosphatidylglycerol:prolipoprotein diacylglycerol transferase
MCPELFHIGSFPIRAFGIGLALSFLFGVYYVRRVTVRDGKDFEPYLVFAYIMIFGGVIGARLAYVVLHWSDFSNDLLATFNPFQSGHFGIAGLNLYGGVLVAITGSWLYARVKKIPILEVFDYFAPALVLGIGISRIGCYLNGCCFGTPTDLPWGVEFPIGSIPWAVFGSVHLHPAQLYSSLYGFGLFFLLNYLMKRRAFVGQLVAILLMSEAAFRFAIEYVRYYESEMHFTWLGMHPTYNQLASWALFIAGALTYWLARKKGQERSGTVDFSSRSRSV